MVNSNSSSTFRAENVSASFASIPLDNGCEYKKIKRLRSFPGKSERSKKERDTFSRSSMLVSLPSLHLLWSVIFIVAPCHATSEGEDIEGLFKVSSRGSPPSLLFSPDDQPGLLGASISGQYGSMGAPHLIPPTGTTMPISGEML